MLSARSMQVSVYASRHSTATCAIGRGYIRRETHQHAREVVKRSAGQSIQTVEMQAESGDLLPVAGVQLLPTQRLPRGQHRLPAAKNADWRAIGRQLEPMPKARSQGVPASRFEA